MGGLHLPYAQWLVLLISTFIEGLPCFLIHLLGKLCGLQSRLWYVYRALTMRKLLQYTNATSFGWKIQDTWNPMFGRRRHSTTEKESRNQSPKCLSTKRFSLLFFGLVDKPLEYRGKGASWDGGQTEATFTQGLPFCRTTQHSLFSSDLLHLLSHVIHKQRINNKHLSLLCDSTTPPHN